MEPAGPALALPAPTVDESKTALPYVDGQYNDPQMAKTVEALIQAEMRTFKPDRDYLEPWPAYEPNFDNHPLLQAEWMRVCDQQPMSKIDTSRYQLDPPPPDMQSDPAAWKRAVQNAQAQLEQQATRVSNLELLQQHGANLWRAHLHALDASSAHLKRADGALGEQLEAINRKRKSEQLAAGPRLQALERDWVGTVKKNLEIEAQCLKVEAENAVLLEAVEAKRRGR